MPEEPIVAAGAVTQSPTDGNRLTAMSREELERRATDWLNGARAPRLRERPEGGKGPYEFADPPGEALVRCLRASGTPDPLLQNLLLGQAGNSAGSVGKPDKTQVELWNDGAAMMNAIAPKTPLEGMLATQMVATHSLALQLVGRANWNEDSELRMKYASLAAKLMQTFTAQIEALHRLRGIGTKQLVRVEHVHVEAGGQAIVGLVKGAGGGNRK